MTSTHPRQLERYRRQTDGFKSGPNTIPTARCYCCGQFSLKDREGKALNVAHVGLGKCAHDSQVGLYKSAGYPRECVKFSQCDHGPARRAWVDKKGRIQVV